MILQLLFPIRHESTIDETDYWYISIETCFYLNRSRYRGNIFKVSILGFGLRVKIL